MQVKRIFIIVIYFFTLARLTAQPIILSESNRVKVVDISLAPSINRQGDKIIQINFIKFKKLNKGIDTKQMILYTTNGKEIKLLNPVKDTCFMSSEKSRSWYATFKLSPEQIELIKLENLSELVFYMNDHRQSRKFPLSKAEELKDLVIKHF